MPKPAAAVLPAPHAAAAVGGHAAAAESAPAAPASVAKAVRPAAPTKRRVASAKPPPSALQRFLGALPLLVLGCACIAGLAVTWQRSTSSRHDELLRSGSLSGLGSLRSSDGTEQFFVCNSTAASDGAPLSSCRYSSLVSLPSVLLPPAWTVDTDLGPLVVQRQFADPLLLTLPQVLTQAECDELIAEAYKIGFHRSATTHGYTEERTSSAALLHPLHPTMRKFTRRIEQVANVSADEFEVGPVIRYKIGEHFAEHWDSWYTPPHQGRRLTFFVPLGAAPDEDGGHTGFPLLQYRFPPRNGSAILWRNFQPDADDLAPDLRMKHTGEAPRRGHKYAINVWI